ncbi:MAG TPA: hypothetical protein DHU81_10465, partial [Hyphomonas sp.]|nr:hypothetical protein [Hyphomonas sp.]
AGKTGTAQVRRITREERLSGVRSGSEIARELRDHALFVAYAPADNPKYAISVVVEHGEGGSRTAAPVARDILHFALKTDSLHIQRVMDVDGGDQRGKGIQIL